MFTPIAPSQFYCSSTCKGKNAYYKRVYGLTEKEYENMKENQNYRCAICNSEGFMIGSNNHTEKLAVDHDHNTGKVRELLCHNCNRGLGLFQDNIEILETALKYLIKHKETH
jgi:nitrate/TMAO reductase-like tetraheme cytochrome c subunit